MRSRVNLTKSPLPFSPESPAGEIDQQAISFLNQVYPFSFPVLLGLP